MPRKKIIKDEVAKISVTQKPKNGRPEKYTKEVIDSLAEQLEQWLKVPTNIWFKDFCLDKDINPNIMTQWAKESEKFSRSYELAKHRQESRLVNGGLTNAYNCSMVKLILTYSHDWCEKQENQMSPAQPQIDLEQRNAELESENREFKRKYENNG